MGYQESLVFCDSKQNFIKLCKKLNSSKGILEEYVNVYAIGKLKEPVGVRNWLTEECDYYYPEGTYFVWWGGDRHPYQSGARTPEEKRVFTSTTSSWQCVFYENLDNLDTLASGLDARKKGVCQENNRIRLFEIPYGNSIQEDYVEAIEHPPKAEKA